MTTYKKGDSRFRKVSYVNGRLTVTWFGAVYGPPRKSPVFKAGDKVQLIAGSTVDSVTMASEDGSRTATWHVTGYVGGPSARDAAVASWRDVASLPTHEQCKEVHASAVAPAVRAAKSNALVTALLALNHSIAHGFVLELAGSVGDEEQTVRAIAARAGFDVYRIDDTRVAVVKSV